MAKPQSMEYEDLARRHKDAVYRQMVRVCGNYDDAEDVLVEALLAAYKSLPQLKDEEAFRGWLAVIGRRVCTKLQRREALWPVLSLSGLGEADLEVMDQRTDLEAEAEMGQVTNCIKSAVADLPDPLRRVYVAREIEGQSAEDTSRQLGITVAAVKSRLHRARGAVRTSLDRGLCTP